MPHEGDDVRPRVGPAPRPGTPEYFLKAIEEVPWDQKHQYAPGLVLSLAFAGQLPRVRDEADVAAVAGRIMEHRVRPAVQGTDVQLAGLYEDIATAVRLFKPPPRPSKARRGASSAPAVRPVVVADPVEHFRGEYIHESTDLVVRGAGIDFAFHRTYRHQTLYDGPLGHRWDHGYNLFLTINEQRALLWTGTGRQEAYLRHPRWGHEGFDYFVPPDGVDATLEPMGVPDAPAGWVRRSPDGLRHVFEPEPGWSGAFRLARIEDRWGNHLRFVYVDGKLDRCFVNHAQRWVRFHHDQQGRLVRVADFTGRAWRYEYDSHGDLIYVISPATSGRARAAVTEYRYSTAEHPSGPLAHNLTDVFDPGGRHYLRNRYGQDAGQEDFNRVVYQRLAGGDFWFRYGAVEPDDGAHLPLQDRPAFRCWMKGRNGHQTLHVYNAVGNLLRKEETHKAISAAATRAVWRYRYNRDGHLVASRSPDGVVVHHLTGRDHFCHVHGIDPDPPGAEDGLWRHDALTAAVRRGFARVLATVRRARLHASPRFTWSERWGDVYRADPDDIVTKHTYEPVYGQVLTSSDPRTTSSADPEAMEGPAYHRLLTRYEYDGPAGDPSRDLVRVIAPTPTHPDGTVGGAVETRIVGRDGRGRVTRSIDARGTETRTDYFPESAGVRGGFVQRTVVDPGDPSAGHLDMITEYEIDDLGRVLATIRPRGVEAGDGRFVERVEYDALDRAVVKRGPLLTEIRTRFEPAGKPNRIEVDWRDPEGAMRGVMVRRMSYNEEHQVVKETWGGEEIGSHIRVAHRYDPAGTLRFTMAGNDTTVHFRYDARDLLVKTIRSFGVAGESTEVLLRDRDGRVVARRSGEGRTETYEFDAFGRVAAVVEPLGHVTRTSYDKGGRPTVVRRFERRADGSYWLLARSETEYDELGRAVRTVANRFDDPVPASDVSRDHEAGPGPGRRVETLSFLDASGRVVAAVDSLGHATTTDHDAIGRVVRVTDPLGNRIETAFDAHGNAVRVDRRDVVRDLAGNVVGQEVLTWTATYDERDRMVTETDGLGNVIEHRYDSLDRRVLTKDPLGNVTEVEYDVYGRVVSTAERRTDSGLGNGNPLPPAVVRYEHDRGGNVTAQIDALGRRTEYRFDRSNRRIEEVFPDGARVVTRYDRDDLVVAVRDAHGAIQRHEYDQAGRPERTRIDDAELDAEVQLAGARLVEYRHDGLGRRIFAGNATARLSTRFDSLGNNLRDEAIIADAGGLALTVERAHDDAGRVSGLVYPEGRRLRHLRDALGRLRAIQHDADGTGYPGSATASPRSLCELAYAGQRLRELARGNATTTNIRHDAAGRRIEISNHGSAGSLLRVQQLLDGARNPRLRLETQLQPGAPADPRCERFGYDAQYQLRSRVDALPRPPSDLSPLQPPAVPERPVPQRQALADAIIGPYLPATPSAPADTWNLDLVGNRERADRLTGGGHSYQVNDRDQYVTIDGTAHRYDRSGNLIADGRFSYTYDAWRRLCRVVNTASGVLVAAYAYDPAGRRVLEESADGVLVVAYDGDDRIADHRAGTCVAQYVHGSSAVDLVHVATGGADHWYHADLQGAIRALTDDAGAVVGAYRYDPYGALLRSAGVPIGAPQAGVVAQPFAFAGRPLDVATGLYNLRARSYAPAVGRFLQRDPAGPTDGTNLYTYAGNHPLAFGDPFGLSRSDLDRTSHDAVLDRMDVSPIYQTIPWHERASMFALREVVPRAVGAVRVAGGVSLAVAGTGLLLVPGLEWAAPVVVLLAADQAQAGLRQMWSGEHTRSNLNTAVAEVTGNEMFADLFEGAALLGAGGLSTTIPRGSPPTVVSRATRGRVMRTPSRWSYGRPPPGAAGATDPFGNIVVKRSLSHYEQIRTLAHEGVHQWLSPSQGRVTAATASTMDKVRAAAGQWVYDKSQLFRFTEELVAEWIATGSFRQGLALAKGYDIGVMRVGAEAAAAGYGFYRSFRFGAWLSDDE